MPTTARLVTLEDDCPSTGISAVRRPGTQASAHRENVVSVDIPHENGAACRLAALCAASNCPSSFRTRSFNCAFSASRQAIFASAASRAAWYSEMDFGCDTKCDVNVDVI